MNAATEELKGLSFEELENLQSDVTMDLDPEANWGDTPPPPDDGEYMFTFEVNPKLNAFPGESDKMGKYFSLGIIGTVVEPDSPFNNRKVFGVVNTMTFNGASSISSLAKAIGLDVPSRGLANALVASVMRKLAEQPMAKAKIAWKLGYKVTAEDGSTSYETPYKGQKSFPQNSDGSYKHKLVIGDVEYTAQAEFKRFSPID